MNIKGITIIIPDTPPEEFAAIVVKNISSKMPVPSLWERIEPAVVYAFLFTAFIAVWVIL